MNYSAIDGDISDFFDAAPDLQAHFKTEDLRAFLLNQGHADLDVRDAVLQWQKDNFEKVDGTWRVFRLTDAGLAAVFRLTRSSYSSNRLRTAR